MWQTENNTYIHKCSKGKIQWTELTVLLLCEAGLTFKSHYHLVTYFSFVVWIVTQKWLVQKYTANIQSATHFPRENEFLLTPPGCKCMSCATIIDWLLNLLIGTIYNHMLSGFWERIMNFFQIIFISSLC